jgi:hypothetical protein
LPSSVFRADQEGLNMANAPANIVYPINGETYPISDPAPGALDSAYVTASFSLTCAGGPHSVKWGFDNNGVGGAEFYDQLSVQFVHKLSGGQHTFFVLSKCGDDRVEFAVGQ